MALTIRARLSDVTQANLLRLKAAAVEVLGGIDNSELIERIVDSSSPSQFRAYLERQRRPKPAPVAK